MNIPKPVKSALNKMNNALLGGSEDQIIEAIQGLALSEVFAPEAIEYARARRKIPLTLLISTLAVSNEVYPKQAESWLECYQSITNKTLSGKLAQLSENNILRTVVELLANCPVLERKSYRSCIGSEQDWVNAFELLIDFRNLTKAQTLTEALLLKKFGFNIWPSIAKALINRFDVYQEEPFKTDNDIDHVVMARLFEISAGALKNGKSESISQKLFHRCALCLESAGDYASAVQWLSQNTNNQNFVQRKIDLARCLTKENRIPDAICELDLALAKSCDKVAIETECTENSIEISETKTGDKKFDIENASIALSQLTEICTKEDIKIFLVSGTLLGYAREGKLLGHDKDIDVGVIGWETQYQICQALVKSVCFKFDASFLSGKKTYCLPILHISTGIWIDIFIYHPEGDKLVTGLDFLFGYQQKFGFTPFELKQVNFLGVDMYVPSDIDLNLCENYGNWKIPDTNYMSHLESPSTLDKGGLAHMLTARLHALKSLMTNKPRKLKKVIQILQDYSDSPWAMQPDLLRKMGKAYLSIEHPSHSEHQYLKIEEIVHA